MDEKILQNRVDELRTCGVNITNSYPAKNLEPNKHWFRNVLGEIETAELLTHHFDPKTIFVNPKIEGPGDIDIAIQLTPLIYFQIKDWSVEFAAHQKPIAEINKNVVNDIRREIYKLGLYGKSSYSYAELELHTKGEYKIKNLDITEVDFSTPTNVYNLNYDDSTFLKSSINKLRKNIDKSFIQLEEYHKSAILMPVMNTKRYPISELRLLGTLKKMLERSNKWEKLAGVLIINSGIDTKQDRSFFIQNPNFKKNAILDKFDLINVNKMESELMDRSLNPILADQFLEGKEKDWIDNQPQMEIKQDNLYIGRDFFHKLPQNTIAYGFKTPTDQGFYLLKNH